MGDLVYFGRLKIQWYRVKIVLSEEGECSPYPDLGNRSADRKGAQVRNDHIA